MSNPRPSRRALAERALFLLVIYGIGASAMVLGGLFEAFLRARRRLRQREAPLTANEALTTD